jgi:hypothetical protein
VAQVVTPADPTEADQREVFTSLADQGQLPGRTFDDIRPSLTRELLGRHLGLRNALLDAMHRYHVVVNPRYAPVAFPVEIRLGEQVSAYVQLPLVER